MTHSISFRASQRSRRPTDAIRHLYIAGMPLPAAKRLVALAEEGGLASGAFHLLPGNSGLLRSLAVSGYDATM